MKPLHCLPKGVQYSPTPLLFPLSPGLTHESGGVGSPPPAPPAPLELDELLPLEPPLSLDEHAKPASTAAGTTTNQILTA